MRCNNLLTQYLILSVILLILAGCPDPGRQDSPPANTRSFYLGFSPWPYRVEGDYAEVAYAYDLIQEHGDIVAHHFQQGVPWPEAYDMAADPQISSLPSEITGEFGTRSGQTDSVKRIYLAVDCLNSSRDAITGYWGTDYDSNGSKEQQPMPDNSGGTPDIPDTDTFNWGSFDFADQEIADAFISYSIALIDAFTDAGFDVEYYNYASEISDLKLHDTTAYAKFLTFAQRVYAGLKAEYPDLELMVSAALKNPNDLKTSTITSALTTETNGSSHGPLTDYFDVLGISVYPYAFFDPAVSDDSGEGDNGLADLPDDWASQITAMAGGKPVAFTETGWIAEDLSIPAYSLTRYSSEANQKQFVEELFSEAQSLDAEFIIWFSLVDYSHFWDNVLGDNVSAIWRDSGLMDYDGTTDISGDPAGLQPASAGITARSGLQVWDQWLGYGVK